MLSLLVFSVLATVCQGLGTSNCGSTPIAPELDAGDRVVNGREAVPGSWPWHAGIHYPPSWDSLYFCGATLIDDQHVLTAAHCTASLQPLLARIYLGSHQRIIKDDSQVDIEVDHMCMHKDPLKDVAVIKLKDKVKFSNSIQPACLPGIGDEVSENDTVYATGWGRTDAWDSTSRAAVLMQAELAVLSHERCNRDFRPPSRPAPDYAICTRPVQGTVCQHDSGGPLVRKSADGRWILEGVLYLGPRLCTSKDRALLFISTAKLAPWLREYERAEGDPEELLNFCDMAPNVTRLFLNDAVQWTP
ncbi:chymotrypsinogen B2-like [Ornithodoros turicata]|uniref:chymotrypsinogen B2-like n=1 Tax=Ornithodoros turicata TaxID=34597 RepID=UPI003139D357